MKKRVLSDMIGRGGFMKAIILTLFMMLLTSTLKAEDRIKVAILDSGISYSQSTKDYACKKSHKSYIDESIFVNSRHGENIISIIAPSINPKTHCIVSYKVWKNPDTTGEQSIIATVKALRAIAMDYSIRYLNISMGGEEPSYDEKRYIRRLLVRGVTITVSAGNNGTNLSARCNFYPACYRKTLKYSKFYVIGSILPSTNYGSVVTDIVSGYNVGIPAKSGTSQSSAQKMASILKSVVYSNRRTNDKLQQTKRSNRKVRNYR